MRSANGIGFARFNNGATLIGSVAALCVAFVSAARGNIHQRRRAFRYKGGLHVREAARNMRACNELLVTVENGVTSARDVHFRPRKGFVVHRECATLWESFHPWKCPAKTIHSRSQLFNPFLPRCFTRLFCLLFSYNLRLCLELRNLQKHEALSVNASPVLLGG